MYAKNLEKKSIDLQGLYKSITEANNQGFCKHYIPHFLFVSDEVKMDLIKNGFKIYQGSWDGIVNDCLIIEW